VNGPHTYNEERVIKGVHDLAGEPKKRTPHAAQGDRRSHLRLRAANLVPCPQCKSPKPSHQACPHPQQHLER